MMGRTRSPRSGNHPPTFPGFSLFPFKSGAIVEGFATNAVLQIAGGAVGGSAGGLGLRPEVLVGGEESLGFELLVV